MHQEIAGQSNENNTIITNNKKSLVNKSHQRQQFEDLERTMQSLAMGNGVGCNLTGTGMAATPIDCPHQSNLQQRRQSSFDLHEGFLPSSPSSSSSSSNSSFEAGMNGIEHHHQQSTTPKRSKAQLKKCLHLDLLSISNNIVNNATFSPTSAERMSGGGGILSPWNHPQFQLRRGQRPSKLFPVHLLPYLYLGNDETAKDRETLDKCGIRYVVNVTSNLPNYFEAANAEKEENTENGGGQPIAYMRIPVDDNSSHNLTEFFPQAISFIEKARSERAAVLVHCWAGISRSVTVCLAYLMYALHLSLEQAYDRLLKQNGTIAPNFHFMEALTCWERDLCAASFSSAAMGIHLPTQQPKGGAPPPRSPSAFSPINIEAQAAAVP